MHLTITTIALIALTWAGFAAVDAVQDAPRWVEGVK
jgi:hypothetical protein